MPSERLARLLEPVGEAAAPAADAREADRDRARRAPRAPRARSASSCSCPSERDPEERAQRVVAPVEERAGDAVPSERRSSSSVGGLGGEHDVAAGRGRSRAGRRGPRARAARSPPASCSKKSLMRFFSVSRSISCDLLDRRQRPGWRRRARGRPRSVPSATRRPSSSSSATSGTATRGRRGRCARAPGRARRARSTPAPRRSRATTLCESKLLRAPGRAGRRGRRRRGAGARRARRDGGQELRRASRPWRVVSASSVSCSSSSHPPAHLLVEARVLDRARRRARRSRRGSRPRPP